jgi:hypothetical protein
VTEAVARALVVGAGVYFAVGAAFAVAFVLRGAARIDPAARGATWGFRLAILPGAAALWPLLARRWARGTPPPEERNAHRDAVRRLAGAASPATPPPAGRPSGEPP